MGVTWTRKASCERDFSITGRLASGVCRLPKTMGCAYLWVLCLGVLVSCEELNQVLRMISSPQHGSRLHDAVSDRLSSRPEVFVFSVTNKNWQQYSWSKITTLVECGYHDDDLLNHAHAWNASVVFLADFSVETLTNATLRKTWIEQQVNYLVKNKLDGVNIDFEEDINCTDTERRNGFTLLMKELSSSMRAVLPRVQITIDFASAPRADNRCYDYKALSDIVDFAFIMAYDERSQIVGPCIAWANSPYNMTMAGIKQFIELNIPTSKLVLGVPWYGYDYPCINYLFQDNTCYIEPVPFRGVACSDAAGKQYGYSNLMDKLKQWTITGRLWNEDAKSPYFTYKEPITYDLHQVWFDDKESLKLKYDMALKLGLRGVGMWEADSLDYDSPDKHQYLHDMWDTLP